MVRTAGRTILRPEIELDIPSAANNLMINIETHQSLMSVNYGNVYWILLFFFFAQFQKVILL